MGTGTHGMLKELGNRQNWRFPEKDRDMETDCSRPTEKVYIVIQA